MNYVLILIPSTTLVTGGISGYYLGRYQATLIDKIRTLEGQTREVAEPTVTMGVLAPGLATFSTNAPVGIAETKTPQLLDFENEQSIEKQGLS